MKIKVGLMGIAALLVALSTPGNISAQTQTDKPEANEAIDSEAIPKAPEAAPREEEEKFIYNAQGMRDPFVSLLEQGSKNNKGLTGLAGMQIAELNLQGIQIGMGKLAIVEGSDKKVYAMHIGDSVLDGKLVDIEPNKVVFEKIIFDPFGRVKDKQLIEIYLH